MSTETEFLRNFLTDLLAADLPKGLHVATIGVCMASAGNISPEEFKFTIEFVERHLGEHDEDLAQRAIKCLRMNREFAFRQLGPTRVSISPKMREAVFARDGDRCTYCSKSEGPFHLDHIWPVSRGGETTVDNLVVACRACNLSKAGRTFIEWCGRSN
jgi:ribosomal protein L31E